MFHFKALGSIDLSKILAIEPILEKVISVIKEVGKENGYDYVLDSSKNQGVILADGDDLMEKVKIKLGF